MAARTIRAVVVELVRVGVLRLQKEDVDVVLLEEVERVGVPVVDVAINQDESGPGRADVHLQVAANEVPIVLW